MDLEDRLKTKGRELGFDLVGIAAAQTPSGIDRLRDWLAKGLEGEMGYMSRHGDARRHPESILPGVQSVVMVGMNYRAPPSEPRGGGTGLPALQYPGGASDCRAGKPVAPADGQPQFKPRISCYAWGADYHDLLRDRLKQLLGWVREQAPQAKGRVVVDTAPLLERDFARLAGLGWFGKNTMLLNKKMGSWFFLGALLLDIPLKADQPFEANHCGSCTACLDACPTQAFTGPGELDARRCISYLTIELRGPIPRELRQPMGDWLFGCDICQDVCPWNRKAPPTREPAFQPREELTTTDLRDLLTLDASRLRPLIAGTTLTRAKRSGLLRNAAIALGNIGHPAAVPGLTTALADDEPLVRAASAWALGRIGSPEARAALLQRQLMEQDPTVQDELNAAAE